MTSSNVVIGDRKEKTSTVVVTREGERKRNEKHKEIERVEEEKKTNDG